MSVDVCLDLIFFCMYFAIYVLSAYDGYTEYFISEDVD